MKSNDVSRDGLRKAGDKTLADSSKWITCNAPDETALEVAKQALAIRLNRVRVLLPLAAERYQEGVEYVHQLRVSCRRANAALAAFGRFIAPKRRKKLTRLLNKIRRSANDARDTDVLLLRMRKEAKSRPELLEVLQTVGARRAPAQRPLLKWNTIGQERWAKLVPKVIARLRWRGEEDAPTFRQLGQTHVQVEIERVLQLARESLEDAEVLHEVRIAVKRLRYTMEIFADAFPPKFRSKLYPEVSKLQERLGEINDHATAQLVFEELLGPLDGNLAVTDLKELASAERTAFKKRRDTFLERWSKQKVDQLEVGFQTVVKEAKALAMEAL